MALPHARWLEPIDLGAPSDTVSRSLVKTGRLQLLRLVVGPDEPQPDHCVDAESVVQCIEGRAEVVTASARQPLAAGQLLVVPAGERHSIAAAERAVVVVTLLLRDGDAGDRGGRGAVTLAGEDDGPRPPDETTPSRFQA